MALSPDGGTLAVLTCSNFSARYLHLIGMQTQAIVQTLAVPAGFVGVAYSPDGQSIYVSGGSANQVLTFSKSKTGSFAAATNYSLPWSEPAGMGVHPSDGRLFVALNATNKLAVIDPVSRTVTKQVATGSFPYAAVVSRDGRSVFVSNWGGRTPAANDVTDGAVPVVVDPATGIANNGTVTMLDSHSLTVTHQIAVGLHPSAMVLSPAGDLLYVANSNSDSISVVSTTLFRVQATIAVRPYTGAPLGSLPNALALSADGATLYVANGGNNAVAVVDLSRPTPVVRGFIPTGWFPSSLALSPDGTKLVVGSGYGFGSVKAAGTGRSYTNRDGQISFLTIPDAATLAANTLQVNKNNGASNRAAVPAFTGGVSPIQHVFYIIKENRTYDQVFGDLPQGNGEPSLVTFGRTVTPNHHALAEQFVLFDNYYAAGDQSAQGHQWCDEAFANDYVQKYGNARNDFAGTNPMAYSPAGFLWDHARALGKTVKVYGEFVATQSKTPQATWTAAYSDWQKGGGGIRYAVDTRVAGLRPLLAKNFPGFDMNVPDQVRADLFLADFNKADQSNTVPNLTIILLPADHTSGTAPGSPTPRAMVADNDLALGRIVAAISHSKAWSSSAVFVTEDDAQDGLDHVDGHRTVALIASPWIKRRAVDSTVYSTPGFVRTIEQILGMPPMNQFDLGAAPMFPAFSNVADYTPYTYLNPQTALNEMNPGIVALHGMQRFLALASSKMDFSQPDAAPEDLLNRAIWHSTKGYTRPYPAPKDADD